MELGSDLAANLQEKQRSKGHVELYNMNAVDHVQTLWNSTSQAAWVLQQINFKENKEIEGRTYAFKEAEKTY